jgi:hypothetical protein
MELSELKEIWESEQKKRLHRIEINEKRVNEITVYNSIIN